MSKNDIELISSGIVSLLHSDEVATMVSSVANNVAAICGDGFEALPPVHFGTRISVLVKATTYEARVKNSEENTLIKAIGGGAF